MPAGKFSRLPEPSPQREAHRRGASRLLGPPWALPANPSHADADAIFDHLKDCSIDPIFRKPFNSLSRTQFKGIILILGFGYRYRS
jgi:hypothetical protein